MGRGGGGAVVVDRPGDSDLAAMKTSPRRRGRVDMKAAPARWHGGSHQAPAPGRGGECSGDRSQCLPF